MSGNKATSRSSRAAHEPSACEDNVVKRLHIKAKGLEHCHSACTEAFTDLILLPVFREHGRVGATQAIGVEQAAADMPAFRLCSIFACR